MSSKLPADRCVFTAEGEVVEILDEVDARRAKVILRPGTVIDVMATKDAEVHLGDWITVEGTICPMTAHSRRTP